VLGRARHSRDNPSMGMLATPMMLGTAFIGVALLITWPLAICADRCLSGNLGDPLLNAWIVGWGAERFADGLAGVWDAPIFHPHEDTLAYSEHLLGIAALVAPVYWFSQNAILAYNVAFIAAYALAAFGMYLLAKQLTGRADVSFVIALAFASSPYLTTSQTTRLQMLFCGWMAIGLAGLHAYFETRSRARLALFAVAYIMLGLSNVYLFVFFAIPVVLVIGYGMVTARGRLRPAIELALALAIVVAAIAPIAGLYRGVQRDMTLARSLEENVRYSAAVRSYATVWHESPLTRWLPEEVIADRALFPGLTITTLALLHVSRLFARRRGRARHEPMASPPAPPSAIQTCSTRSWSAVYAVTVLAAFALSLGPVPHLGAAPIGETGPYAWLMQMVPGLDGLRAPARFGVIVLLGLGALAATGLASCLEGRSGRVRALVIVGTCLAAVAEAAIAPSRLVSFPGKKLAPTEQRAFDWLANEPPGALLVLPIVPDHFRSPPLAGVTQTLVYQYATLQHERPILNGSSGFKPPLIELLEGEASPFQDLDHLADALQMARALGVRYVMLHEDDFESRAHLQRLTELLRGAIDHVEGERAFGGIRIFALRAADAAAPAPPMAPPLPTSRFRLFASGQPQGVADAIDRDLASAWSSQTPQAGSEWLKLHFDGPIDVAHVRLSLSQDALGDYPRRLHVVSIGSDGDTRTLFDGSPIVPLALALTRRPAQRAIDLALDENRTEQLLVRQVGRSDSHRWSVHELAVWERPAASGY
jgi:hypothetical protein